jgi:outer membrane protein OmpA-like peptidoglycan-associated protein
VLQEYFTKKGIESKRLNITPLGDSKSVTDSTTNEGKEKSNRVEVSFKFN